MCSAFVGWREDGGWEKLVPGLFLWTDNGRTSAVTLYLDLRLGELLQLCLEDLTPGVGVGP